MPDGERDWWHAVQVLIDAARAQREAEGRREKREVMIIVLLAAIYTALVFAVARVIW